TGVQTLLFRSPSAIRPVSIPTDTSGSKNNPDRIHSYRVCLCRPMRSHTSALFRYSSITFLSCCDDMGAAATRYAHIPSLYTCGGVNGSSTVSEGSCPHRYR